MKRLLLVLSLALLLPAAGMADAETLNGKRGATSITGNNTTVTNNGRIKGGSQTGLTVNGSNNRVVNNGTIRGTTGVSMTGGSSSLVNNGTIRATSSSSSSSRAVGISQGN